MAANKAMAEAAAKRGERQQFLNNAGDGWIDVQNHTFTSWLNAKLDKGGFPKVDNMAEGMRNGMCLCQMLGVVSGKDVGRYNKDPKLPFHELENLNAAFAFMKKEGLTLVNVGPEDIHKGNQKLVLGLMWTIIYNYQIAATFKNAPAAHGKKGGAKDLLLEWVRSKIPEYNIKNFNTDWADGRAFCALTNAVGGEPWVLPNHREMHPESAKRNAQTGFDAAWDYLGVPKVLDPDDITNPALDELSVMTYVSSFRTAVRKAKGEAPKEIPPDKVKDIPVVVAAPPPAKEPVKEAAPKNAGLPSPWERDPNWRVYEGEDLGSRCKIKVYFSSTTSSMTTRKNTEEIMKLMERYKVHERPDFVPWDPVDLMDKDRRDKIFARAGTRDLPQLWVDDKFIGSYDNIMEMNENNQLAKVFEY